MVENWIEKKLWTWSISRESNKTQKRQISKDLNQSLWFSCVTICLALCDYGFIFCFRWVFFDFLFNFRFWFWKCIVRVAEGGDMLFQMIFAQKTDSKLDFLRINIFWVLNYWFLCANRTLKYVWFEWKYLVYKRISISLYPLVVLLIPCNRWDITRLSFSIKLQFVQNFM